MCVYVCVCADLQSLAGGGRLDLGGSHHHVHPLMSHALCVVSVDVGDPTYDHVRVTDRLHLRTDKQWESNARERFFRFTVRKEE